MKIIALDVGEVRIGVARSDDLGITAQPLCTWVRPPTGWSMEGLARDIAALAPDRLVVGKPLQMNGVAGIQARKVRKFAQSLHKLLPNLSFHWWDERLSTAAVQRVLLEGNVRRSRRKEVADKMAAAYILQGYLDNLRRNSEERERDQSFRPQDQREQK